MEFLDNKTSRCYGSLGVLWFDSKPVVPVDNCVVTRRDWKCYLIGILNGSIYLFLSYPSYK